MDSKRRKVGEQSVDSLRLESRWKYLAEREATQVALLRRQVVEEAEEEERLGSKLSEKERREFAKNRETLKLAEARNAIDEHRDGYILPDADYSNKTEVLTKRHKEPGYEKSEVALWEEEQMSKIKAQVKRPDRIQEENYEYVFDEEQAIKWVSDVPVDHDKQMLQQQLDVAEQRAKTIEETRKSLPVFAYRQEFLDALKNHNAMVIIGETGSGKSTQIPQYLYESGYAEKGVIAITQPRRVAAMSVSKRVAEEAGVRLGAEVGYSIRFENHVSEKTKIKFCTDGILLREIQSSPLLDNYSVIIIDEAHERSLNTDLLLPLLRDCLRARSDLKVLIMSATINAETFSAYFDNAPCFQIPGRTFSVGINYCMSPEANYLAASISTAMQIHIAAPLPGDILIFLTGEDEIIACQEALEQTVQKLRGRVKELIVLPIYSSLSSEQQAKVFEPTAPGTRRVVVSTNISETSITLDSVKHVIDCGMSKELSYNPTTNTESLVITPISRASADQRAGRAGRVSNGSAYRLYTKWSYYNELLPMNVPEIQKVCLDSVCLTLKALNVNNLIDFDFVDKPDVNSIMKSLETLYALGALDSTGSLTRCGRRIAELPLNIKLAKVLLSAEQFGCREEVLSIVSLLGESSSLFVRPKDKRVAADAARSGFTSKEGGDMLTYLNVWNQFVESGYDALWARSSFLEYRTLNRARNVREQLEALCDRVEVPDSSCGISDHVAIRRCITSAFFSNAARLQKDGQSYRALATGQTLFIHPSSSLHEQKPRWVVYWEAVSTSKDYMRGVMPIEGEWLHELAPHFHKAKDIDALGTNKKMGKGQGKVGTGR
jgi:pre-mRNA-splicing factor ATP-dependent RNA helicase DHX16